MDQEPLTEEQILAKLAELEAKKARLAHRENMPEATPEPARPDDNFDKDTEPDAVETPTHDTSSTKKRKIENRPERRTPEQEVDDTVEELNLADIMPPEFMNLNVAQRLKVIRDLKRRIVDIVKSDAQTQYSEDAKGKSMLRSITKEGDVRNLEKQAFTRLKETPEGQYIIQKDLELLINKTKNEEVIVARGGNPCVVYVNTYTPYSRLTNKEWKQYYDFNVTANIFARVPYEWGQERGGKHKKEYEKAKKEYERARDEVLKIKTEIEGPQKAMLEVFGIDSAVQMEQLLNTHPEFERVLDDFSKDPSKVENLKANVLNVLQGIVGKNKEGHLLFAGGYVARMGVRAVTNMNILGGIAVATVGGVIGGIRGRLRGKQTLEDRQKQARHGQKDESLEKARMVDAVRLTNGLRKMHEETYAATTIEEKERNLTKLKIVVEHAQGQIELGQVNFGDAKSALTNQFEFVNSLNKALALTETYSFRINTELKEKIDGLLENYSTKKGKQISEIQRTFINKQMLKGATIGAGFATAGYVLRWVGEEMGWWGGHSVENANTPRGSASDTVNTPSGTRPNIEDATRGAGNVNPQDVAPTTTTPSAPSVENIFSTKSVTFESGSGKGAIAGIAELKQQLRETYNGDFSKAPQNVRDFMNTDPTKEAMKLGLYDPTNQNESALIQEGTILKFDEHGNLLFGRPDASGNIPMLEKYHGAMLDTDHSAQASTGASTETSTTPGNPANVPETAAPTPDFSPEDPNTFQYHPDKGFKTPKEKQDEIFDKVKFGETENKFTPEELKRRIEEQIDAHTAKRGEYANAYNPPRNFPSQFRDGSGFGQEGGVVHPYTPPRNMQYYLGRNGYSALNRNLESANQSLLSPEFAKNPFHLSGEKILEVFQVHKANIDIIFPGDHIEDWEDVKYLSPSRMLGNPEYENGPEYRPIMDYLHKLVEVTKLKPKGTGLIGLGRPETTNEYIARALQKASELGKLEELKK